MYNIQYYGAPSPSSISPVTYKLGGTVRQVDAKYNKPKMQKTFNCQVYWLAKAGPARQARAVDSCLLHLTQLLMKVHYDDYDATLCELPNSWLWCKLTEATMLQIALAMNHTAWLRLLIKHKIRICALHGKCPVPHPPRARGCFIGGLTLPLDHK